MSVRDRRLDEPTVKLSREDLIRAAREADAKARADEAAAALPSTKRPPAYAEIDVSVELPDGERDIDALLQDGEDGLPRDLPNDQSDIRPAWRRDEAFALTSVPCVVVAKEDLSWFGLDATAEVVLTMIDGESTVESIMAKLTIGRDEALTVLRELGSHGVVEFH